MEILAATGNANKVREMRHILAPLGVKVLSPSDIGGIPDVVENGDSFEENARKKALEVAKAMNRNVAADDSGLEVAALDGAPGIYSARYAGEGGNDGRNVRKLLDNMKQENNRQARFVCVIAVATPNGIVGTAEGEIRGTIARKARGNGGFGYDPVFVPEGGTETFAELPPETKNSMSHRRNALRAAVDQGLFRDLA